jgi:carboxylate-amine ligase
VETRTLGVEEELIVVDPATRAVTPRASELLRLNRDRDGRSPRNATDELDQELFRHQVEIRTEPVHELADLLEQLAAARSTAGDAAAGAGLAVVACATIAMEGAEPRVSPNDRYRDMLETYGQVARYGTTCGMHVHVAIESPDEGVACIDRMAPWLPVLMAISSNSPYFEGRDTGYASWRSQLWSQWPSAGPTEAFGSLDGYRRSCEALLASGAARDAGMLYFDARLAARHPTVEVRVLDVCTDLEDTALLAALVRALVETTAGEWAEGGRLPEWRSEELRAASWRASRMGLSERLVHPVTRDLRPAREVLEDLVAHVRTRLEAAHDLERVQEGLQRVLGGTGSTRQRAAYERTGSVEGVVDDLMSRTEASYASRVST